jgi:hypothetical protein
MTYLRSCLLVVLGGCGLISSDVTDFTLKTQTHMFTVDASSYMVNQTAANAYLMQSCASAPTECAQWVQSACTTNCSGSCDMTTQKCDLGLDVGVYQKVDLNADNPELATVSKEPIVKVTIDSITYTVTENSLNVATPEMTVYVAPMSVMSPSDAMAQTVGTIPEVPAMTTVGSANMMFTPDGKQNLVTIMGSYMTPFNVIVGSTIVLKSGDPVPTGKLTAEVDITAHASY